MIEENLLDNQTENDAQLLETININVPVMLDKSKIFTTSLIIAKAFGKRHDNILRDIANIECSEEFSRLNFEETHYALDCGQGSRNLRMFNLTRDGFSILVMGFTGKAAMVWKEKFLAAFNAMEKAMHDVLARNRIDNPRREPEEVTRQRCINLIKALSAIWAHTDNIEISVTDTALSALLSRKNIDETESEDLIKVISFVYNVTYAIDKPHKNDESTSRQFEILHRIAVGCSQFKFFRDNFICENVSKENFTDKTIEKAIRAVISEFWWRHGCNQGLSKIATTVKSE